MFFLNNICKAFDLLQFLIVKYDGYPGLLLLVLLNICLQLSVLDIFFKAQASGNTILS